MSESSLSDQNTELAGGVPSLPRKLTLPLGLIGFSEYTEYSLEAVPGSPPFLLMQAVGDGAPEFVVMQPEGMIENYQLVLRDEDCDALGIGGAADALVVNIVTIRSMNPQHVTVNLAGPVVINRATGRARQIILTNGQRYSTEHVLVDQRPPADSTFSNLESRSKE